MEYHKKDVFPFEEIEKKYPNSDFLPYGGVFAPKISNIEYNDGSSKYFYEVFTTKPIDSIESINSFIIDRDYDLENKKYNEIVKNIGLNYILINEDVSRNFIINKKIINENLTLFNINNSSQMCFDMIKVIENAKEIHLISTFWSLIIYNLQKKYGLFNNIPIYFHNYVRNGYYDFLYRDSNWIFIKNTCFFGGRKICYSSKNLL